MTAQQSPGDKGIQEGGLMGDGAKAIDCEPQYWERSGDRCVADPTGHLGKAGPYGDEWSWM